MRAIARKTAKTTAKRMLYNYLGKVRNCHPSAIAIPADTSLLNSVSVSEICRRIGCCAETGILQLATCCLQPPTCLTSFLAPPGCFPRWS